MSNNKQQTAVEQFAIALYENGFLTGNGDKIQELLEKAKEMENEQRSIKLPSNEEIKKMMELDGMEFDEFDPYDVSYLGGATWMRNKIQGDKQ